MIEELKKALEGVEVDFNLDDFKILSNEDFTSMVEGYKGDIDEAKVKGEKSGQKVGQEILLKELKDELGFEYDQRKNPENLKKAYIEKFGKPEPLKDGNKDLEEQFKLQGDQYAKDLKERDDKYESLKLSHKRESDNKAIKEALTTSFSSFGDKTDYKVNDLVKLAVLENEFIVDDDGNVFQSIDGEAVKNDIHQKITHEAFSKTMMLDGDYIKKSEGGRVIGDETRGGKYTIETYVAAAESRGENVNGIDFAEKMEVDQKNGLIE